MKLEATDWVMMLSGAFSREEQQAELLYIYIYIFI